MSAANSDRKVKVISGTPKAGDFQNQEAVPLVANTSGIVYVQDRKNRILSLSGADSTLGADLASTAAGKGASLVAIQDAAANFSSGTVEAALAEILSLLADQTGSNGDRLIGVKRSIAGASSTTLHNWIEKHWVAVTDFGAVGTGLVGDTTAIQAAIDAVGAAGGGTVYFPEGAYLMSATVTVDYDNIRLLGEGPRRSYWTKADSASFKYLQVNSASADSDGLNLSEGNTLAANVAFGASTVSLSAGKGANFTAGTYALMASNTTIPGSGVSNRQAEFAFIFSKAGDTLTLGRPLRYSYTTAANAQLYNINTFLTGFELDGIGFDGASYAYTGSVNNGNVIELYWCLRPVIRNFEAWELPNTCINLMACYGAVLNNIRVRDTMSEGFLGFSDGFGYAIVEQGLNEGLSATQISCDGVRHAYTTTERTQLGYGAPTGSVIGDSISKNARGAGFDTHECGSDITFINCSTIGSMHVGFQARCVRTSFIGCAARDCIGSGLNISSDARSTYISGLRAIRTNTGTAASIDWTERGAIYDDGEKTTIDSFYTEETGGPGLQVADGADFGNYRNGIIRDPAQVAATNTYGIVATDSGPTKFHVSDTLVHDTGSNVTNAAQLTASSFSNVVVTDFRSIGHSGILVGGADGAVQTVRGAGVYAMAMGRRDETLTVSVAGVIDVENTRSPYIAVAAPGASANLDTINGGLEGCQIFLERNGADIVVRDASVGGGNIELVGATSFTLNGNNDSICLRKRADVWREQWRADV